MTETDNERLLRKLERLHEAVVDGMLQEIESSIENEQLINTSLYQAATAILKLNNVTARGRDPKSAVVSGLKALLPPATTEGQEDVSLPFAFKVEIPKPKDVVIERRHGK